MLNYCGIDFVETLSGLLVPVALHKLLVSERVMICSRGVVVVKGYSDGTQRFASLDNYPKDHRLHLEGHTKLSNQHLSDFITDGLLSDATVEDFLDD